MGGVCSRDRGILAACGRDKSGPYATLQQLFHTPRKHKLIVAEVEVCYNTRRYPGCRAIQYDRKGPRYIGTLQKREHTHMNCGRCGTGLPDSAAICTTCGTIN